MSFERFDFSAKPLRIGVLGASRIVNKAVVLPARDASMEGKVEIVAVAARDIERARAFADEQEIPVAHGSYDELIADPNVDAVYNALPASGHAPWSEMALRSGKHVLCEKPFGLHVDEAHRCISASLESRRLLMEAHHWRYHPLIDASEEVLRTFEEPVVIEGVFDGSLTNPGDIRKNPALGPGVLMDFGCYLIQWSAWAARIVRGETRPLASRVTRALITEDGPGIDMAAEVDLDFEGISAKLRCDMRPGTPFVAYVRVRAGDRVLHFESPLIGEGARLEVTENGSTRTTRTPGPSTYLGQMHAFVRALETGEAPLTSGEDIIATQGTLDAIYAHAGVIGRRELRERASGQEVQREFPRDSLGTA